MQIGFIAPNQEMMEAGKAMQAAGRLPREVDFFLGDLQDGVRIAHGLAYQKYDVIISRGGTAKVIRKAVDLPIVEVQITGYDALRMLIPYQSTSYQVAILGYENIVRGFLPVLERLGIKAYVEVVEDEDEVAGKVKELQSLGVGVVLGDTVSVTQAKALGLETVLVTSGPESIERAVFEAVKIAEAIQSDRQKKRRLHAILNLSNDAIVFIRPSGMIELFNPAAERILEIDHREVIGKKMNDCDCCHGFFRQIQKAEDLDNRVMKFGKTRAMVTKEVIRNANEGIGTVVTMKDVTEVLELEARIRKDLLGRGLVAKKSFDNLIGSSASFQAAIERAKTYSKTGSNILIRGESGTGKEVFAQAIHLESNRSEGPFVAINCAALPAEILESELFGYEEGAFTGAKRGGKRGIFELAHKGTIFLDEIGEMDVQLQSRLLRVLQEREIMRIGGDRVIPVDVRVICATNKDLKMAVRQGEFRGDLYYRINVLRVEIPPLRKRIEDLHELSDRLAKHYQKKYGMKERGVEESAWERLKRHPFEGNIRELQNIMQRAVLMGNGIVAQKVLDEVLLDEAEIVVEQAGETLQDRERFWIEQVLREEGFNKSRAAERLGIHRVTLNKKLNAFREE